MKENSTVIFCIDHSNTPKEESELIFSLLWDFLKIPCKPDKIEVIPIEILRKAFGSLVDLSNSLYADLELQIKNWDNKIEKYLLFAVDNQWYRVIDQDGYELGFLSKIGYDLSPN